MKSEDIFVVIGGVVAIIGVLVGAAFLLPLIVALFGAFAGWVISLVFTETSRDFLDAIGMGKLAMWQFGAMIAFVGSYFKASFIKPS